MLWNILSQITTSERSTSMNKDAEKIVLNEDNDYFAVVSDMAL
jgi:hypothetical protein